jgi:hypothetical protein
MLMVSKSIGLENNRQYFLDLVEGLWFIRLGKYMKKVMGLDKQEMAEH